MVKQKKVYCPFVSIILFLLYDGNSWDKGMNTTLRSNVWSDNHRAVSFVVMYRTLFVLEKYFQNRILMCKHIAKNIPIFYHHDTLIRGRCFYFKRYQKGVFSHFSNHSLILATSFVHCGTLLILNNFDSVVKQNCFSI